MAGARDASSRLRQLNPLLTTSLGGHRNQPSTPHSAVSTHSPYAAQTPASAIQPYNPQEWGASPAVAPERPFQFPPAQPYQGPTVSSPPPPPYSPPHGPRSVSAACQTPPANISAARVPATNVQRPSPDPRVNQNFPPPPGANGRGASRETRFGLPSFSRRKEASRATTPPDVHPPVSIPRSQDPGVQIPHQSEHPVDQSIPPNSRRAASASAIDTPTSARSRSASHSRWEAAVTVPPPPPGPPPSQSRSQSLNRTSEPIAPPPTKRPPPGGIAALGPVPPTPNNWRDERLENRERSSNSGLTVDTSSVDSSGSQNQSDTSGSNSAGAGLSRTGAIRNEKTLRQRRNESRTRHTRGDSETDIQPLSDIWVPRGSSLTRRLSIRRGTPRSEERAFRNSPWSGDLGGEEESRNATPRPVGTPTPPFSPHPQKDYAASDLFRPVATKALPTPPLQSRPASSSQTRPGMSTCLATAPLFSAPITKQTVVQQTAHQFCKGAIERFQVFADLEAAAPSDVARVKLFTDFIVHESRLRRERYSSAIGAMGSEIFDLTRDLFRPLEPRRDSLNSQNDGEWTSQLSEASSHPGSMSSASRDQGRSASAPASANLLMSPMGGTPHNLACSSSYMPSLSPILSMSVSEAPDERDPRGRPSSRWWETESAGEGSSGMERSKRESKYMGVPKEAREALQWFDPPSSADTGGSQHDSVNQYPPEKTGWHEPDSSKVTPQNYHPSPFSIPASTPNTPSMSHLDISRLVTLPPPYPRHYPAVNNSHPDLAEMRTSVRSLSDMNEITATRERFVVESQGTRDEAVEAASERKQALRAHLQQEIGSGAMSYAEAAAIEATTNESERAKAKELEKKDFEAFQNAVVLPLNEVLVARIAQATSLFDQLRSQLSVEAQAPTDPNVVQEEGDERPELLEKLTLLKWIFEARETLHRAVYELLSDRNDRYRDVVLTPYRLAGNGDKARSAAAFFAEDAAKRQAAFAADTQRRARELRDAVAENAVGGVDRQLNAFWDIAPPLRRLLDAIPADDDGLARLAIQIPAAELDENPAYRRHPLQYLFSLLLHAEKSTHQFIDGQTNLLCLLHEVEGAAVAAAARADGGPAAVDELTRARLDRLTDDLKDKVRVVQGQWDEGLGDSLRGVKERVGEWLLSTGGWDESLEDGGVGVV